MKLNNKEEGFTIQNVPIKSYLDGGTASLLEASFTIQNVPIKY